jgi:DNA-binding transcriptional ArsR family regulator
MGKRKNLEVAKLLSWVERVAKFWSEQSGLPAITGRVVGWLMISDPPEQCAAEIARSIGASRASLTTSLRLLMAIGLLHSLRRPGERTIYYRIDDDAWEKVLRRRIASMASFREITQEGLALLGPDSLRAARIKTADEVYEWAQQVFAEAPPRASAKRVSRTEGSKAAKRRPL